MTPESRTKEALVIMGSGRSGTTWVLDAIAASNNLHTVFEPLHSAVGVGARKYAGRYIRPDSRDNEFRQFMDTIIYGELHTIWSDYRALPDRLMPEWRTFVTPRKTMEMYSHYMNLWKNFKKRKSMKGSSGVAVKFIRANLMLNWLVANYDLKVLFLIRHPCAVIESKMRLDLSARKANLSHGVSDWNPQPLLAQYLEDDAFQEDLIAPYFGHIDKKKYTDVEAHALIWCFENVPVLMGIQRDNVCVTSYENLVTNGKTEWPRIAEKLCLNNLPGEARLISPSQQASEDFRRNALDETKLARWQERLNETSIADIGNILARFNVDLYSVFDPMPIKDVLEFEQGGRVN
jgi:hypothetical protein